MEKINEFQNSAKMTMAKLRKILEELKEKKFEELHLLFKKGLPPAFEEFNGETNGQFLALKPGISPLIKFFIKILFESPIGKWTGKKFITPFTTENKGMGVNLFKNKIFPQRFRFEIYIKKSIFDGNPCLALDYGPYHSLMFNLIDDVRKIEDGILLGQMRFKFPLKKESMFIGYFSLWKKGV